MTERGADLPAGGGPAKPGDAPAAEQARPAAAARRRSRSRAAGFVYSGSAVAFAAVLGALSWQVASGRDPALGEGEPVAATPPAKRVLVRRIVRRVVVTRDAPAEPAPASAPAAPPPAATEPAPVPAPAPAPPTTRAS